MAPVSFAFRQQGVEIETITALSHEEITITEGERSVMQVESTESSKWITSLQEREESAETNQKIANTKR